MSTFENISNTILDIILGVLLPVLLPAAGEEEVARAAAVELLAAHNPRSAKELCLAAETIAYSLRGLTLVAQSNDPGVSPEQRITTITWACRLDSAAARAQRRLDEAQRARRQQQRTAPSSEPASPEPEAMAAAGGTALPQAAPAASPDLPPATEPAMEPATEPATGPVSAPNPSAATAGAAAVSDIDQAELTLRTAETLLQIMKDRWKGAPPPHSQAAQQIKAQERAVNLARMTLAQARRRAADAATATSVTTAA